MGNDYLNNRRGAEVWRAAKFANPMAGKTEEPLTDRDGLQANTIAEKEETLKRVSCPPNEYNQYFELPPAGQAHQFVTKEAVERAQLSLTFSKA